VADEDLTAVLPVSTDDSAQLQQLFGAKGFSARELVALSGAHAIGSSQFTAPIVCALTCSPCAVQSMSADRQ
jgi:L-ascorbate peroxidase